MIGFLRGKITQKNSPLLLLEVQGVGYEILCSNTCFYQLPAEETDVFLLTHFIVREDAQLLYGFIDTRERDLFRALIKVNGVGPKLALTILSGITVDEFVMSIQTDDVARLQTIPGIGAKTAKRLLIEIRDALKGWQAHTIASEIAAEPVNSAAQDAISALVGLGYKLPEAKKAVAQVYEPGQKSAVVIRLALKTMAEKISS